MPVVADCAGTSNVLACANAGVAVATQTIAVVAIKALRPIPIPIFPSHIGRFPYAPDLQETSAANFLFRRRPFFQRSGLPMRICAGLDRSTGTPREIGRAHV